MNALKLLFSTYWEPILAITLCLSIVGYIGYQRYEINGLKRDGELYKLQVEVAAKTKEAEVSGIISKQAEVTTTTALAYNDSIQRLRGYYAKHLSAKSKTSISTTGNVADSMRGATEIGGGGLPEVPGPASEPNATAQSDQPSTTAVTAIDCAEDVLTLLSLQKWAREQINVNK